MGNISSLKEVNIANIIIKGAALDDLVVVLSQNELKELDVSSNNLQTAGAIKIFQNIKHLTSFTKLNIAHNMITDEATKYIATVLSNCSGLVELNLSHNNFHNMGAVHCKTILNLTKIDFSNNNIDEQTVNELSAVLSHCVKLEELNLANNNLQTAGAIKLFKRVTWISLKMINISGNCITANAADHIASSLSKSKNLREIDLSCNALDNLAIRKILHSLEILNLTKLNVSNNTTTNTDFLIRYILVCAINLVAFDFSYNRLYLTNLNQCCSNLVQLNMCNNGITDEEAPALALVLSSNSKLQELDISHNSLKPKGIIKIFEKLNISHLNKLNVSNNVIGEQGADTVGSFLSKNVKLKELDIGCNNLNKSGTKLLCKRITNLSNLSKLKIDGNNIAHIAVDYVTEVLLCNMKLEEIDISDNNLLAAGTVLIFNGMKNIFTLRNVNISHNWITYEAADSIAGVLSQNIHLRKLYLAKNHLGTNGIIALCKGMSNILYLTHLDMSCNKITDEAAHDIAAILIHNPELKELDLSNNLMQTPGVTIVCKAIRILTNLSKLNISNNNITDEAIWDLAIVLSKMKPLEEFILNYNLEASNPVQIFLTMKSCTSLFKLNVGSTEITDLAACTFNIAAVLKNGNIKINKMKRLDLSYNNLDATGITTIFKKLNISHLTKINISHNAIGEQATDDIGNFLSKNTELKELDLSYNNLCAASISNICTKLNISHLTKINISNNAIGEQAAGDIGNFLSKNTELKELDLSYNNLYAAGISNICTKLNISHLTKINISNNAIGEQAADDIGNFLSKNTELKELDLSHNNLDATGISNICRNLNISHLTKINISNNAIDEQAADDIGNFLSKNTELKELDLSHNNLDATGIRNICRKLNISHLTKINISNNAIGEQAADDIGNFLSKNTELKELDLSYNNLCAASISNICTKLNISHLTKINISNNAIGEQAAGDIGNFLSKNTELKELDLSYNNLYAAGISNICTKLNISHLTKINISNNAIGEQAADDIGNFLSKNTELKELDLSHNNLDATGISNICRNLNISHLTKINISNNAIGEQAADDIGNFLSKNTELIELDLSHNNLDATGISNIFRKLNISHLTKINISNNAVGEQAAGDIGNFLSKNTKLKELDLSHNNLCAAGICNVCRKLHVNISHLTKINISNNTIGVQAADDIGNFLSKNTELKELDLSYNNLDARGISNICRTLKISHLTKINISNNAIGEQAADDIGNFLSKNTKLKELDISCNNLYESGIKTLCKRIANLSKLSKLKVGGNDFTYLVADDVVKVLLGNINLQEIDLSDNNLLAAGAVSIFNGMKNMFFLRNVNISHNWISNEAADNIAAVLSQNTCLNELYLANNYMEASGIIVLCKGMSKISHLTHLDMSCNKITDEAAHDIAALLSHNPELKELDLSNNLIQATGATRIFNVIIANLNKMNICKNSITDEAADAMANFLSQSSKLKEFDVSYNYIQAVGAVKIFKAIKTSNVSKLNMSNNMITDDATHDITAALSKRTKLKEVNLKDNKMVYFTFRNIPKHWISESMKLIL